MTVSAGIFAALLAPFLEAAGFLEWDIHWKRGGGSAFALNLYKCNLAAFGFLVMTVFANNSGYIRYASDWSRDGHSPYGVQPGGHAMHVENIGGGGGGEDPADRWDRRNWKDYLRERTEKMLSSRSGEERERDDGGGSPNDGGGGVGPMSPAAKAAVSDRQPPPPPGQQQAGSNRPPPGQQQQGVVAGAQNMPMGRPLEPRDSERVSPQTPQQPPPLQGGHQGRQTPQDHPQQQQQQADQRATQQQQGLRQQQQQVQGGAGPQQQQSQQRQPQNQNPNPGKGPPQQQGGTGQQQQQQQQQAAQQRQQQQQVQQAARQQQAQSQAPPQQQQQQAPQQNQQQQQQQQGPGRPQQPGQPQAPRRRLQQQQQAASPAAAGAPPVEHARYPPPQLLRQEPIQQPPPLVTPREQQQQQQQQQQIRERIAHQSDSPLPAEEDDDHNHNFMPPPPNLPYLPPDAYSKRQSKSSPEYSKYSWDSVGPILLGSFLGILIGDCAELEALRLIGARRVLVVDTAKPFAAAFLGTIVLGEPLHPAAIAGMLLTAYGVYMVLKDSMERMERAVERGRRESAQRALSGGGRLSRASSVGSTGSEEGGALSGAGSGSGGGGGGRNSSTPEARKIMMVGMRRGSISRHDLSSEYSDAVATASGFGGYDDDIGLFLEDGREFVHPEDSMGDFGSCGSYGNLRRRYSFGSTGSGGGGMPGWGRKDSLGGSSVGSFDSAEYAGFDDDPEGDYFLGSSGVGARSPRTSEMPGGAESAQDAASHNVVVEMPFRAQSHHLAAATARSQSPGLVRAKSALRKSRFSVTALNQVETAPVATASAVSSAAESSASDFEKSLIGTIGVSMEANGAGGAVHLPPMQIPARTRLSSSGGSASVVSSASFRSMSTLGTECGPPPDWYPGRARETREGREIRLRLGYGLALLNVLFDAYASLLTKQHGSGMTTWEINLLRMGFAGAAMLAISGALRGRDYLAWRWRARGATAAAAARGGRRAPKPDGAGKHRYFDREWSSDEGSGSGGGLESLDHYHIPDAYAWYRMPSMAGGPWVVVSVGVLFVSFLSPALQNYALFEIAMALAITLGSVTPLFTLPLGWLLKGERPTRKGVLGAGTAALGVVVLCLWGIELEG